MTATQDHSAATGEHNPGESLEQIAGRLDETMAQIAALPADAKQTVSAALASLDALHRKALVHIVQQLRADDRGRELLYELVDDPTVRMVLSMHEIIRPDPVTAANRALASVRPMLHSHGGDASVDRVEGTVAYIRLEGACNGCSMSSVTLRDTVSAALLDQVPGLSAVEVVDTAEPTVIPLSQVTVRRTDVKELAESGWVPSLAVTSVTSGSLVPVSLPGTEVLLVGLPTGVTAYVNECAHQGLPLDNGILDLTEGTLTCPWHGLCYDAISGECTSLPGAQLDPLPTQVVDGTIWIRPAGHQ